MWSVNIFLAFKKRSENYGCSTNSLFLFARKLVSLVRGSSAVGLSYLRVCKTEEYQKLGCSLKPPPIMTSEQIHCTHANRACKTAPSFRFCSSSRIAG